MPQRFGEEVLWDVLPSQVEVSFLMPNGIFILLKVDRDSTLASIKEACWKEAETYPAFELLQLASEYIFVGVTQNGEKEKFYDELRRFCDLRLFQPILKAIEHSGNRTEKIFNAKIKSMVGQSASDTGVSRRDTEEVLFRHNINKFCRSIVEEREAKGVEELAYYYYPPDVFPNSQIPTHIFETLKKDDFKFKLMVWLDVELNDRCKFTLHIKYNDTISQVVMESLRKKVRSENSQGGEEMLVVRASNCIVKVCSLNEYLLGNYPLCQYKYIRQCLVTGRLPELMLVDKGAFYSTLKKHSPPSQDLSDWVPEPAQAEEEQENLSIWEIDKHFRVKINHVSNLNCKEQSDLFIKVGLYQGQEPLCQSKCSREVCSSDAVWGEWMELKVALKDLPRSAQLCLALCHSEAKKNKKKTDCAVWQCNVALFNFKGLYLDSVPQHGHSNGEVRLDLSMWSPHPACEDLLCPVGFSGGVKNAYSPVISISLERVLPPHQSLAYPSSCDTIKHGFSLRKKNLGKNSKRYLRRVGVLKSRDPLSELSEQDKQFLWKMREFCVKKAHSMLPKLVQSVRWNCRDDVAMLQELLTRCPQMTTDTALELLHAHCTDPFIRSFAVDCLNDRLSTYHLSHYLLQLVHALEFEAYYDNSLLRLLLKRALNNTKVGQAFFWYIRCIMSHSSRSAYYAIILDTYLRHCGHLETLWRQLQAVEKMNNLSEAIKAEKDEAQVKSLQRMLMKKECVEALNNIISPLNPSVALETLDISKCEVKTSKKRPIVLTWSSQQLPSPTSSQVIFKTGDDLRQDMLTLQVFELMNGIWEMEGLDVRLLPYRCLSTGSMAGMIEVVGGAVTVMQVMEKDFNSKRLHSWIKEHNAPTKLPGEPCAYKQAVETFSRSCAGYCVATFVLGIGDRHPSNIMVTQSGQVFHIDFGHFLNHRKKKFGINRERVPFVLTEDFIRVIAKGNENAIKSEEFLNFMELCGKAYLYLRKHSSLIISLFSMMLSSGMPELQSLDDVEYLRKTLMVETALDQEALSYFQDRFNEAYGGAWTTKVDWFFHWVKHNA